MPTGLHTLQYLARPSLPSLPSLRGTSWSQRLFLLVLCGNVVLVLVGLFVVPAALSATLGAPLSRPDGPIDLLGALGMQVVLALLALIGPLSFGRYARTMKISFAFGTVFAAAYLGLLGLDYASIFLPFDNGPTDIYLLFVGIALLAGGWASVRTRRLRDGAVAAIWALVIGTAIWSLGWLLINYTLWGSPQWYQFWLQDGAVSDFRQSGGADLALALLQDIQGALFWHQVLSGVVGALGGVLGGGIALGVDQLRRIPRWPTPFRA
jgi:hypothetical protein